MSHVSGMPNKLTVNKSKKKALFIIALAVIILILFSSEPLYSVFGDGVPIPERFGGVSAFLNNDVQIIPIEIPGIALIIAIIFQLVNLFRTRKVLEISNDGIYHKKLLYNWSYIENNEILHGTKSFEITYGSTRAAGRAARLKFNYLDKKISININSIDISTEQIENAIFYFQEEFKKKTHK
jgi:hypothetical protein